MGSEQDGQGRDRQGMEAKMMELHKLSRDIRAITEELEQRLEYVLCPQLPDQPMTGDENKAQSTSTATGEIQQISGVLYDTKAKLREIIGRLDF